MLYPIELQGPASMQRHDNRSRNAGSQVSLWERAAPAFSTASTSHRCVVALQTELREVTQFGPLQ